MTHEAEFEGFMRRYQDMVYATAVRLVGNEAEAQDLAQETFVRAYHQFETLKDSPTVGGWLKTVVRNLSLNHIARYQSRWKFFSNIFSQEDGESLPFDVPDEPETGDVWESEEQQVRLEEALRTLPTAQRVPLVLFHVEEMSYEQIADQLGVSLSKVKTDIFRGRKSLRQALGVIA